MTKAYGAISSPPAADALQASLTSISMSVDENVYTFMDRFQSLLANIHITFEAIEEAPQAERLSFTQVYQSCLYTAAKWNTTHPNNPAFTHHLTVLLRLLSAITDTRLHKVVYDFNTKYTSNQERTVERLVKQLFRSTNNLATKFPTLQLPTKTRQKSSNASGNKRPNNSNDKPSKKSNNGGAFCTNCVKLNAGGESIPDYVMRNHTAANCRIQKKGSSGSNSSKAASKASQPSSTMPLTAEQLTQVPLILHTVQQVSAAGSTKKSKKTSFKDEVPDSSSL